MEDGSKPQSPKEILKIGETGKAIDVSQVKADVNIVKGFFGKLFGGGSRPANTEVLSSQFGVVDMGPNKPSTTETQSPTASSLFGSSEHSVQAPGTNGTNGHAELGSEAKIPVGVGVATPESGAESSSSGSGGLSQPNSEAASSGSSVILSSETPSPAEDSNETSADSPVGALSNSRPIDRSSAPVDWDPFDQKAAHIEEARRRGEAAFRASSQGQDQSSEDSAQGMYGGELSKGGPLFQGVDQPAGTSTDQSDNPSVIAAAEDVAGHNRLREMGEAADRQAEEDRVRQENERQAREQAERTSIGDRWSAMDAEEDPEARRRRQEAGQVDQNAEDQVRDAAADRILRHAEEAREREAREAAERERQAREQAERTSIGDRWSAMDVEEDPEARRRRQEAGQVDQNAEDQVRDEAAARLLRRADEERRRDAAERDEGPETPDAGRGRFWRGVADRLPFRGVRPEAVRAVAVDMARRYGVGVLVAAAAETAAHMAGVPLHGVEQAAVIGGIAAGVNNLVDQWRRNRPAVNAEMDDRTRESFATWYNGMTDQMFGAAARREGVTDSDELRRRADEQMGRFNAAGTTPAERENMVREALATANLERSSGATADDIARASRELPAELVATVVRNLDVSTPEKLRERMDEFRATMRERLAAHARRIGGRELAGRALLGGAVGVGVHELLDMFQPGEVVTPPEDVPQVDQPPAVDNPGEIGMPVEPPSNIEPVTPDLNPLLRGLPTTEAEFPTVGPSGENFATFSGWAQAEAVKAIREMAAQDPSVLDRFDPAIRDLINHGSGFDMNNPYDVDLASRLSASPQFRELFDPNAPFHQEMTKWITEKNVATAARVTERGGDLQFAAQSGDKFNLPSMRDLLQRMLSR